MCGCLWSPPTVPQAGASHLRLFTAHGVLDPLGGAGLGAKLCTERGGLASWEQVLHGECEEDVSGPNEGAEAACRSDVGSGD